MRKVFVITDLGFGNSGKGTIVSTLCKKHSPGLIVRHNGGTQLPEANGDSLTMFGSGALDRVTTLLSSRISVDPIVCYKEEEYLHKTLGDTVYDLLKIDFNCLVTTAYHKLVQRARGASGRPYYTSTGATVEYGEYDHTALRVKDLFSNRSTLRGKLAHIQKWAISIISELDQPKFLEAATLRDVFENQLDIFPQILAKYQLVEGNHYIKATEGHIIFEGTQGVLLDEEWGFYPNITKSSTTAKNALDLLYFSEVDYDQYEDIGVMRAYQIRKGLGPLPTETSSLDFIKDYSKAKDLRVGYLDIPLINYAIHANGGIDSLAVTCFDHIENRDVKMAIAYDTDLSKQAGGLSAQEERGKQLEKAVPAYIESRVDAHYLKLIVSLLNVKIGILSTGKEAHQKEFAQK